MYTNKVVEVELMYLGCLRQPSHRWRCPCTHRQYSMRFPRQRLNPNLRVPRPSLAR